MIRRTLVALGLCFTSAPAAAVAEPVSVSVEPIEHFSPASARDGDRVGRLAFRGGLELGGVRGLGGLSGVLVDGDRLTAVTDSGAWFFARMYAEDGRLKGLSETALVPRLDLGGRPSRAKRRADAETLAVRDGMILVGIEQAGDVLAYEAEGVRPVGHPRALGLSSAASRRLRRLGFEAMTDVPGGPLLLFTEGQGRRGDHPVARVPGASFTLARRGPWAVTGATALPGGDVIIAERRYSGGIDVGFRIRRLGAEAVRRGQGPVDGPVLLEADLSAQIDNMEAIAADTTDDGIVLTVLSDDNFRFYQRTLILRFLLVETLPRARPERPGT